MSSASQEERMGEEVGWDTGVGLQGETKAEALS